MGILLLSSNLSFPPHRCLSFSDSGTVLLYALFYRYLQSGLGNGNCCCRFSFFWNAANVVCSLIISWISRSIIQLKNATIEEERTSAHMGPVLLHRCKVWSLANILYTSRNCGSSQFAFLLWFFNSTPNPFLLTRSSYSMRNLMSTIQPCFSRHYLDFSRALYVNWLRCMHLRR